MDSRADGCGNTCVSRRGQVPFYLYVHPPCSDESPYIAVTDIIPSIQSVEH